MDIASNVGIMLELLLSLLLITNVYAEAFRADVMPQGSSFTTLLKIHQFDLPKIDERTWGDTFKEPQSLEFAGLAVNVPGGCRVEVNYIGGNIYKMESSKPIKLDLAWGVFQSEFTHVEVELSGSQLRVRDSDLKEGAFKRLFTSNKWVDIKY